MWYALCAISYAQPDSFTGKLYLGYQREGTHNNVVLRKANIEAIISQTSFPREAFIRTS